MTLEIYILLTKLQKTACIDLNTAPHSIYSEVFQSGTDNSKKELWYHKHIFSYKKTS